MKIRILPKTNQCCVASLHGPEHFLTVCSSTYCIFAAYPVNTIGLKNLPQKIAVNITVYLKSSPTVLDSMKSWLIQFPLIDLWNHPIQNTQLLGVCVATQLKKYMHMSICINSLLVGGWTNPLEKYACQIGSFPCLEAKTPINHHPI